MKLFALLLTLGFSLTASANWRAETTRTLNEYSNACDDTVVTVDSIVANQYIKGHIKGLPTEALEKFKVVFYVKTNLWYVHPYAYYPGQPEGFSYSNLTQNGEFTIKSIKRNIPSDKLAAVVVPQSFKIKSTKWWLNPVFGFLGGVLKYDCAYTLVDGNGDF